MPDFSLTETDSIQLQLDFFPCDRCDFSKSKSLIIMAWNLEKDSAESISESLHKIVDDCACR
jgi:hypothetical protein